LSNTAFNAFNCSGQPKPDQANVLAQAQHQIAIQVHFHTDKQFVET
jgi:hypothetical protein